MRVCIVGGGKVGYYLAKTLLEHGHTPVLIEDDPAMCRKVADSLDLTVPRTLLVHAERDSTHLTGTRLPSTARIICPTVISESGFSNRKPPRAPRTVRMIPNCFSLKKICSK